MGKRCAFDRGDDCRALTTKKCRGCKFYKSEADFFESRDQSEARVLQLDPDTKIYIRYKYYGGKRKYGYEG